MSGPGVPAPPPPSVRAPMLRWMGGSGTWTYGRELERRGTRVRVIYGSSTHEVTRWLAETEIEAVAESRFRWAPRHPPAPRRRTPHPDQLTLGLAPEINL